MTTGREKVDRWIAANFEPDAITVDDWPLLPAGKRITDREGDQMLVYYDLLYDRVKTARPDERK